MSSITLFKEQRYDRQLRLWGDRGQEILGKSTVCVLGSGAVGTELLKNLVLPGIGGFTIVDDAIVARKDLGSNFFVTKDDLGKPRSQAVTERLSELNTDVRGKFLVESVDNLIEHDPNFFLGFDVIVYTGIRESQLLRLSTIVSHAHIPIIVCFSIGFIGFLRVSVLEHVVIESHPDSTKPDFRLDNPPESFVRLVNDPENDLDSLSAHQLAEVPWLIIVYKFLVLFQEQHGRFPVSHEDKQKVRKLINEASEALLEKCKSRGETLEPSFELTNFKEAAKSVNTAIAKTEIPPEIVELFNDCRCQHFNYPQDQRSPEWSSKSSNSTGKLLMSTFWKMVGALKAYTENEGDGKLPIRGDLPDMTSSSDRYLKLQAVYREAAETAVEHLASRLSHVQGIRLEDVRILARNAAYLRVIKCRSLEDELKRSPARSDDLHLIPTHPENDAMLWYFMLRGAASFYEEHGRWPGSPSFGVPSTARTAAEGDDEQFSPHVVEQDLPYLRNHVNRVLISSEVAVNRVSDDFVHEMCRFGGGEVHSIASYVGGIAAQEVIKLVTHQFVPISQPLIYNGITQGVSLLEF